MEEIPEELIVNWDETAMKLVPLSSWTMVKKGTKHVKISGVDDKRQITAVLAGSMSGEFLPMKLIFKASTKKCLLSFSFPKDWHLTFSDNHWSTNSTMIDYVTLVIIPHIREKQRALKA